MSLQVNILSSAEPPLQPQVGGHALAELETLMASLEHAKEPAIIETGMIAAAALLTTPQMHQTVADPRQRPRLQQFRHRWAQVWSSLNGQVEFNFTHSRRALLLQELLTECRQHPLFWKHNELFPAEIALLKENIPTLATARVCHIGCGALPYTALHYQPHVGPIVLLDIWSAACQLCHGICHANNLGFEVVEQSAQEHDFSGYDLVLLSSMLSHKHAILQQIVARPPAYLLCRSTSLSRSGGMLENPLTDADLALIPGTFMGQTNPPNHVADLSFLFHLRA